MVYIDMEISAFYSNVKLFSRNELFMMTVYATENLDGQA